ncbi:MAG: glucose-6-phosphate dehydrogenase [Lentisphaerae bacterium RIFOXYA12_FULL_60_10]|nr:MAG: glucose-6-phosphate dehydrogenase [Lentisphaerae bacterium RIFOXYA12_FULL_60_10]
MPSAPDPVTIVVIGASGDLARKKIFPALFALYAQGFLPPDFRIVGFARSAMDHPTFRTRIMEHLTCRYVPGERCADRMQEFLSRCWYRVGDYGSMDAFLGLYEMIRELEAGPVTNRLFYLAIPPSVFLSTARSIGNAGLVACEASSPWSRVVIEKPFGNDRESSDLLVQELGHVFTEDQTYRIDHYLGKEMIQNLMVLRFANQVFEPLWNRRYIDHVSITWAENLTTEGRGGYFDGFGIIRDVMQNHLLQMLALATMECPADLNPTHVRDAKVQLLKAIEPASIDRAVFGQYGPGQVDGRAFLGYRDDPTVPPVSRTPTYAAVVLHIHNERWKGVPFFLCAGKGLSVRRTEIRIRYKVVKNNPFCRPLNCPSACPPANELVIRVQPDEAVILKVVNKVPGLELTMEPQALDLLYHDTFHQLLIPDAYERLLLDVLQGDRSLFIRRDELAAAWDVFTPLLHAMETQTVEPIHYAFGSDGPPEGLALAEQFGIGPA